MKKSNVLIALAMTTILGFTGCSQQVKLETSIGNISDIKSCSYDVTVSAETTGLKNNLDTGMDSAVSSILSAGKVSVNFNGKILKTEDRSKISSNIKASSGGLSFETPIYIDSSNKKLDFDLFLGVPDILKSMLGGDTLANISNLYLSSKDLESYVKKSGTDKEYKDFEDSMAKMFDTKSNKNSQVSKDMLLSFNSYINRNKAKVETFTKLDNESASKNGVYTIKLSKEDLKKIVSDYCNNKVYFSNLKDLLKEAEGLSSVTSGDKVKSAADLDAKTIIENFNKTLDATKTIDIITTLTIENNFGTKTNMKVTVANTDGKVAIEVDSKLSDINKVTSIAAPDKNSDKTLDVMKFIEKMGLGETITK